MIKRLGRLLVIPVVLLGSTLATPRAAGAQAKLEVTPFLGSFYALAKMCTDCNANNDGTNFEGRQLNAAAFGGRLSYWVSRTIGVEAAFGYSPSRPEEREDSPSGFSTAASAKAADPTSWWRATSTTPPSSTRRRSSCTTTRAR